MLLQIDPLLREYPLLHAFLDAHAHDSVHDGHDHEYVLLRGYDHGDDVRAYDLHNQPHRHGRDNAHDPPRGCVRDDAHDLLHDCVRDDAHGLLHDCVRDDAHGLPRGYVRGCAHEHGDDRGHEGIPYHDHGFHAQHPE